MSALEAIIIHTKSVIEAHKNIVICEKHIMGIYGMQKIHTQPFFNLIFALGMK